MIYQWQAYGGGRGKLLIVFSVCTYKYDSDVVDNNRVFSHDVTAAILVSQNNETAAMLVSQTSPLRVELFSYANAFFCYYKFAYILAT